MNKKIALVTLIEASIILSDEDRLMLLDLVPGLTDKQVDALGKFFALERQFILSHEDEVKEKLEEKEEAFVDGIEHLWEYYEDGKLVKFEELNKTGHTSYYTA